MHNSIENKIFFSKYKPDKKIGEGSFGKIYLSHNIQTNEQFAIKLESKKNSQNLLEQEAYILCYLKGEGIPLIKSYGYSGDYNVLVMELLGKSLEELFHECSERFSLKTVCMLGIQMVSLLQYIHNKHILHRDIKPDNFTMGSQKNKNKLYIIDFGLSKKYRSSKTLQHVPYNESKKMTGTARYASIRALKGCEQGRRDDMESVGYVLMYFLRGSLPWQGLKINRKDDRYDKIYEKKKSTTAEELCNGFPHELCEYVNYTRNMEFEQEPDYDYLRGLFSKIMSDHNYQLDYEYDWSILEKKPKKNSSNSVGHINNIKSKIADNSNDNKKRVDSKMKKQKEVIAIKQKILSNNVNNNNNIPNLSTANALNTNNINTLSSNRLNANPSNLNTIKTNNPAQKKKFHQRDFKEKADMVDMNISNVNVNSNTVINKKELKAFEKKNLLKREEPKKTPRKKDKEDKKINDSPITVNVMGSRNKTMEKIEKYRSENQINEEFEKNINEPSTFCKKAQERLQTTISNGNTTATHQNKGIQVKKSSYKFMHDLNTKTSDNNEMIDDESDDDEIIENCDDFESEKCNENTHEKENLLHYQRMSTDITDMKVETCNIM